MNLLVNYFLQLLGSCRGEPVVVLGDACMLNSQASPFVLSRQNLGGRLREICSINHHIYHHWFSSEVESNESISYLIRMFWTTACTHCGWSASML